MATDPQLPGLAIRHLVNEAERSDLEQVLLAHEFEILAIEGAGVRDRATLFDAVTEKLLAGRPCRSWDDLQFGVEELLWSRESERFALIWTGAENMLEAGLGDLLAASDVLATISRSMYKADTVFVVFLLGAGAAFPSLDPGWK